MKVGQRKHIRMKGRGRGKLRKNPPKKIGVKKVIIQWAEGPTALVAKYPKEFSSISEANSELLVDQRYAPVGGAYDKHGFKIIFKDNSTWDGRYDLQRGEGFPDIAKHVRQFVEWHIRHKKDVVAMLGGEKAAKIQKTYKNFLKKYKLE